ncbi:MAG: RIP metalloprotease RseP [Bacteroidales bacterium]|nr:RIP metalloprotease RseP [Bacteroidales bacterium]
MTGLIMAAQLILGLSILVLLHEFGHFIMARAFGIKVEKFYLFFDAWGFKLFKFTYKGTEYGMGWLPLGGYVKIAGMIDESVDKEQMKLPQQPWEFRSKPAWQRLFVMLGGVTVNLILGVILFAMVILVYEKDFVPNSAITGISPYELGEKAGFQEGDKILEINGKKVVRFKDAISMAIIFGADVTVERAGQKQIIHIDENFYDEFKQSNIKTLYEPYLGAVIVDSIVPDRPAALAGMKKGDLIVSINDSIQIVSYPQFIKEIKSLRNTEILLTSIRKEDTLTQTLQIDSLGIGMNRLISELPTENYSLTQAVYYGWKDAMEMLKLNITGIGKIFKGKEKASDSLQGPIGIAKIYGGVWDWHKFWYITGLLSLVLAFMNILPIPALDGGHVLFLLIEVITGRKLSDKFMENVQYIGMLILMALMVFVIGNDIFRLFK